MKSKLINELNKRRKKETNESLTLMIVSPLGKVFCANYFLAPVKKYRASVFEDVFPIKEQIHKRRREMKTNGRR